MARSPLSSSSPASPVPPAFSAVVRSALCAVAVPVARPSSRSFSGWVAVVQFGSASAAAAFARRWAFALGVSVVVRGLSVSVPCSAFLGVSFV